MARPLDRQIQSFIRDIFGRDQKAKEDLSISSRELAMGGGSHTIPYGAIESDSLGGVTDALSLNKKILERYADYEEMDEYGDINCLAGDSLVFTLDSGWKTIEDLSRRDKSFHVISYSKKKRSLVPALCNKVMKTGDFGHGKQMVRVVLDNGASITCTEDHLFMTKGEDWVEAGSLKTGDRLMPGVLRLRKLNTSATGDYWNIHQPHHDSLIKNRETNGNGERWMPLHRLVAIEKIGIKDGEVIHHIDGNCQNNDPFNLSIESVSSHANKHIANIDNSRYFPEWTNERKKEQSKRMIGNTYSLGNVLSDETKNKMSVAGKGRKKSKEWKDKIGLSQPNRIDIPREVVEANYSKCSTVAELARKLGVSWSKAKKLLIGFDLVSDGGNHRVACVEKINTNIPVYDLEVPEYHNFVCNGVIVHNSALDIYADDVTQVDSSTGKSIWINSNSDAVKKDLEDVFYNRLKADEIVWEIARQTCKYGNDFEEIVVGADGVVGLNFLPPATVRRIEGTRGDLKGFIQSYTTDLNVEPAMFDKMKMQGGGAVNDQKNIALFEDWRVTHFRLRSKNRDSVYGWAVTDPARWAWRRLILLEDAVMVYKLTRSPSRYAFYVDVGTQPNREAEKTLLQVKQKLKKRKFVNPKTGKLDFRFNPLSFDEDFFLGVRDGKETTRIDVLNGPSYQQVDDVQYFLYKLYAALKVPRAYLGYDENMPSKATLSQEDVRFARTTLRIQREIRNGFHKVGRVHLASRRIDPASVEFDIAMTVPSSIFEMGQLEVKRTRADIATSMERHVSLYWLLSNIYGMSDEDIKAVMQQKQDEMKKAQSMGAGGGSPFESRIMRHDSLYTSEKALMEGNREHEKRMEEHLKKHINDSNSRLGKQLREVQMLLHELAASRKKIR